MTGRSGWPIPALVFLGSLSTGLAALVRDALPAFPHAFLGLAAGSLLLTIPLLSDLGAFLRTDEAGEWVASLPALAAERTLARTLHVLTLLGALAFAWYVPWAALAPGPFGWAYRLSLPILGFGLAVLLATLWAWAQQGLLGRAEGALITLETVVMVAVVFALVQLISHLPDLAALRPDHPLLACLPPVWYARPLTEGGGWGVPTAILGGCLVALTRLPEGRVRMPRRRVGLQGWLAPLHGLALRHWVRHEERGPFELVWAALPREREIALRTYPMLGIPLAFLLVSAGSGDSDPGGAWRTDLLALLLLTVGVALPLLLTHVPISESHRAVWILRTAPVPPWAVKGGAIKALFLRWLLPLHVGLLVLGLVLWQAGLLVRLWLPSLLLDLLLLRLLYRRCVKGLPLSTAPEDLRSDVDWGGSVAALAVGLTVLAVLANRFLGWAEGLALALALGWIEVLLERRQAAGVQNQTGETVPSQAGRTRKTETRRGQLPPKP